MTSRWIGTPAGWPGSGDGAGARLDPIEGDGRPPTSTAKPPNAVIRAVDRAASRRGDGSTTTVAPDATRRRPGRDGALARDATRPAGRPAAGAGRSRGATLSRGSSYSSPRVRARVSERRVRQQPRPGRARRAGEALDRERGVARLGRARSRPARTRRGRAPTPRAPRTEPPREPGGALGGGDSSLAAGSARRRRAGRGPAGAATHASTSAPSSAPHGSSAADASAPALHRPRGRRSGPRRGRSARATAGRSARRCRSRRRAGARAAARRRAARRPPAPTTPRRPSAGSSSSDLARPRRGPAAPRRPRPPRAAAGPRTTAACSGVQPRVPRRGDGLADQPAAEDARPVGRRDGTRVQPRGERLPLPPARRAAPTMPRSALSARA